MLTFPSSISPPSSTFFFIPKSLSLSLLPSFGYGGLRLLKSLEPLWDSWRQTWPQNKSHTHTHMDKEALTTYKHTHTKIAVFSSHVATCKLTCLQSGLVAYNKMEWKDFFLSVAQLFRWTLSHIFISPFGFFTHFLPLSILPPFCTFLPLTVFLSIISYTSSLLFTHLRQPFNFPSFYLFSNLLPSSSL